MISPFEVYMVMQLDSINSVILILATVLGILSVITTGFAIGFTVDKVDSAPVAVKFAKRMVFGEVLLILLCAALPTTKTAAAMIILPAITSDKITEPLTKEAGELYGLAKDALKNLASEPKTVEQAAQQEPSE